MADKSERTAIFKGLNRMPYIADGEMRDMKNLSSDAYPFITTRKGRKPYTFTTYIPSPESEAYKDIEQLPEPCEAELGNVYKVVGELEPGAFYRYTDGIWVKQDIDISETVTASGENGDMTLISGYATYVEENHKDEYTNVYPKDRSGKLVKYSGETTESFEKNNLYRYYIDVWYDWKETDYYLGSDGNKNEMPVASSGYINIKYMYTGVTTEEFTNGMYYTCYRYMQGCWEAVTDEYLPIIKLPESPDEGEAIRWCSEAGFTNGCYYVGSEDKGMEGTIYFYRKTTSQSDAEPTNYIPKAAEEYVGSTFLYTGPNAGEFAECYYSESGYDWKVVEHPKVARIVTLKDYLDNYDGCGLKEILEIDSYYGELAVLIRDTSGSVKLYHNQKLYGSVNSISENSGKKLVNIGNRMVVGESGSYIYREEGENKFFSQGGTFSYTLTADQCDYGLSGKVKYPEAYGEASTGNATFIFYAPQYYLSNPKPGVNYKELAEALKVPGTGFVVYGSRASNNTKQYLQVTSVTYEPQKLLIRYSKGYSDEYTDYLRIDATGVKEDFDWNVEEYYDDLTFESTDPHYYDVVAWKKRLWGYDDNVLHGTIADIFDEYGVVDWNTGDNTYTEAISQPLWQGGNITGITALMNGLLCFKEDSLTIVTGNYPAIMSSNTIPCRGLPPENRRSVAVAKECVYYLSTDGVYRYSGGIPQCISRDVKIKGTEAVGASDGNKYWLSLKEESGEYALYVYDINYSIWHKEDATNAISFTMIGGEMYMAVGTEIYNINAPQEENTEWMCEFWYDEGTHRKKKYKEFHIRGKVGECEMFLKADEGEWKLLKAVEGKLTIKIPPLECEELSIMLRGKGICEIKSIDRVFEVV